MRFTTKTALFFFIGASAYSQTNNQTSSPYSLFGLGRLNDAAPGKTNALGEGGVALPMTSEINNLNPAAYATIPEKVFMFDLGAKGEKTNYSNTDASQNATTFSFSNIALAFALSQKDGVGITLLPYSDVGYNITGIAGVIEGSDDTYSSDVAGSGGLSNFTVNYGRKISERFNVGIGMNYLFGNIEETEFATIGTDYLAVTQESFYRGLRFTAGMQAVLNKEITFGATAKLPASIKGSKDLTAYKIVDLVQTTLEVSADEPIDSFKLPLEVTMGGYFQVGKSLAINADYKRSFWNATGMQDNIGKFVDQDYLAFGFEYRRNKESFNYLDRVSLRAGFNVDNGYLEVNDKRISNYKGVFGLGLPFPGKTNSMINLSYGFGQRGAVSETLVKENYNTFSFNIVLQDIWFLKRKYD
ncbi:MAG: hypothetical protein EOO50_04990 [Flavobacterium sp.]|uniref:hypothetical protein n=1 Tax=Flavobacterium sp. TaxID=239 RepID=UPI0012283A66|nr:hypothetical protein [Flavobacterium sp.]RZJ67639.1 MAG: hypothetical protein EOO50_04990 [Flavobacterium sp.]